MFVQRHWYCNEINWDVLQVTVSGSLCVSSRLSVTGLDVRVSASAAHKHIKVGVCSA